MGSHATRYLDHGEKQWRKDRHPVEGERTQSTLPSNGNAQLATKPAGMLQLSAGGYRGPAKTNFGQLSAMFLQRFYATPFAKAFALSPRVSSPGVREAALAPR
jgi:hypothetical protein